MQEETAFYTHTDGGTLSQMSELTGNIPDGDYNDDYENNDKLSEKEKRDIMIRDYSTLPPKPFNRETMDAVRQVVRLILNTIRQHRNNTQQKMQALVVPGRWRNN